MNTYEIKHSFDACDHPYRHTEDVNCHCEPKLLAEANRLVVIHLDVHPTLFKTDSTES